MSRSLRGGCALKIHAYRLERQGPGDLADLLERVRARSLEDRFFPGDGQKLRLEELELRGDYLLADFAGPRAGHGPGRMGRAAPITDFDLADDEDFGEDAAVVVHLPSGYSAVQYNHFGPRVSAIETYLGAAEDAMPNPAGRTQYQFGVVLRQNAYERLRRYGFIQEVEFTIALPGIQPDAARGGMSVGNALEAPLPQGVESVSMSLKARPGGSLGHRDAMELVDGLLGRGGDLVRASVWGKEAEGSGRKKPINLLNEHLSVDRALRRHTGQRYARGERWAALGQSLDEWLASGQLRR